MDGSSLIVVMPITTLITLFTGIALPFIAASRPRRIPVHPLRPHPLPRLPGPDTPLGPAGADRQEDGEADLLRQRQLGPTRGRCQPRLHQPRTVRDRYPVPR
jgi:hypothetical protein